MSNAPLPILDWTPSGSGDDLVYERASLARCKPRRIARKAPGTLRVALYGESLAAGFPLAPAFTPAIALEEILKKLLAGVRDVEVIDLAMPNMGPSEQLRVAEASRFLEPDVCVYLTGNNWYYGLAVEPTASPEARVAYAEILSERGPAGFADEFRKRLAERASVMVGALAAAASAAGAKAVFALPACNHAWERLNPPPALGEAKSASWFARLDEARTSETKRDWPGVLDAAAHLSAIEGALTGTPERFRARALKSLGRDHEARDAAMAAVDACNWQNVTWALPQAPSYVTAAMREGANANGMSSVDLAEVFEAHTGSPFFGFELFFDHCHLAADGVRVAMAAVATEVLRSSGETSLPAFAEALACAPTPSAAHAASGALQAAHWLSQFYPDAMSGDASVHLASFLETGTRLEPSHLDVLVDYLALRDPACAPGLNARLPKAARLPGISAVLTSPRLNPVFVEAIVAHLSKHAPEKLEATLAPLIARYQEKLARGFDLTAPQFRSWFWERTPTAWYDPQERQGSPIFRALWSESSFAFVTDASSDIAIEVMWRTRGSRAPVEWRLNGIPFARTGVAPHSSSWKQSRSMAPAALLRRGVNTLSMHWPALSVDEDELLNDAVARLRLGAEAELFCAFGELFSLTVRTLEPQ